MRIPTPEHFPALQSLTLGRPRPVRGRYSNSL